MSPDRALAYAGEHRPRFLDELKEFIRFPSISSQPAHAADIRRCAAWLAKALQRVGLENVRVVPTGGHPVVCGAWLHAKGAPTVLVYGHYDVLPADPLKEWRSPPFDPAVRGDDLFGRGACDDKGQVFTHIKALESFLKTGRGLPVNVKCVFEGEEEMDSPHFAGFVRKNKRALQADAVVLSDTRMLGPDRPAITYAERGTLRVELEVSGPPHDLHSGNFGGAVHNPLQALCEMMAGLHDAHGRIAVPGFYESVREGSDKEREYLARTGPKDADILAAAQVESGWGEQGYSAYERTGLRPALTVNGISGGYNGPGVKAVIPARALAKMSFRLVPDQDPRQIARLFREHIARITPEGVRTSVRALSGARPAVTDRNHPAMQAAAFAYRKAFGATPVFMRSGGTIPVIDMLQRELGVPVVMMGFALPDDRMHGPNEKFHLPNFDKGIATCIWFLTAAAKALSTRRATTERERELAAYGD